MILSFLFFASFRIETKSFSFQAKTTILLPRILFIQNESNVAYFFVEQDI